jgi:hypothetical protein
VTFELRAFRFRFRADAEVVFPPGKAGNTIRGALGLTRLKGSDLFAPAAVGAGPSGFADPPRPFVVRAAHLDGAQIAAGSEFHLDLHLFDLSPATFETFRRAMREMTKSGLGVSRAKARLVSEEPLGGEDGVLIVPLDPLDRPIRRIVLKFPTPTEIKAGGRLVDARDFGALLARVRDRIGTLRRMFGRGPLAVDFRAMGQRAESMICVRQNIRWQAVRRTSSRTGQSHPIGGFTGEAEYTGELGEFVPWLQAAYWTGVGRHTVWGNGAIVTEVHGGG